ncbi:hypothetical protein SELMODRAFT_424289 [Selaginella moellendorffii]|uniref:Uncharacterized protein n=1 Tax=Selaginella moellendorffii TaxID=88036 RepID=D8SPE7_SELML|nr:hypothetical protein SELMODRAFT_424289 [Selaginella moellendorffii]
MANDAALEVLDMISVFATQTRAEKLFRLLAEIELAFQGQVCSRVRQEVADAVDRSCLREGTENRNILPGDGGNGPDARWQVLKLRGSSLQTEHKKMPIYSSTHCMKPVVAIIASYPVTSLSCNFRILLPVTYSADVDRPNNGLRCKVKAPHQVRTSTIVCYEECTPVTDVIQARVLALSNVHNHRLVIQVEPFTISLVSVLSLSIVSVSVSPSNSAVPSLHSLHPTSPRGRRILEAA